MGSLVNASILKGQKRPLKLNLLHCLFEEVAEGKYKGETAIIFEDTDKIISHTYKELNTITNKLGRSIGESIKNGKALPNSDGDYIVAVSMSLTDKLVMTLLAIWKSGAAYLPIDPSFPKNRVEHILSEAKPAFVIYEEEFQFSNQVLSKSINDLLNSAETFSEESIKAEECLKHKTDNLAIVLYTSGSTGISKGVRLPHEIILNRLQWQFNAFPYSATEKVCVFKTALSYIDSASEIWGPLLNGLSILVIPKKITQDPEKLIDFLEKYKIERLVLVPSLLRSLLLFLELQKNYILRKVKIWVCSGETLPIELAKEFFKHFPENEHILCNFYGSTEVMGDVTYHVITRLDQLKNQDKVPIGYPIDNTIIYLLDENLRPVNINSVGELWVSGCNLAAGYVNGRDPDRFITNPYESIHLEFGKLFRTGDYARIENGTILYEGRTDSQVKIRGHRVDLSEVERAVNSIVNIEKGVVLCYNPGNKDQALLAFVTLKDGCLLTETQIEKKLKMKLVSYMLPQVMIMENIPLLVNGKIDRQTLLKSYESTNGDTKIQIDIDYSGVLDNQMAAAKILLETVAMVLNRSARSTINIDANFYDIGGNSLNSILTITKLHEQGYYISIGDFIGAQDLKEVLNQMSPEKLILPTTTSDTMKYTFEMLSSKHKDDVYQLIIDGFDEKADLEQWLVPPIGSTDYSDLLDQVWDVYVKHDLSFVAITECGKIVGVALNMDARDEPEIEVNSQLGIIIEFETYMERPIREGKLPQCKGTIINSNMMATSKSLSAKENVSVIMYMEELLLKIAKDKKFDCILSLNVNQLTQQLGINVYGYEVIEDIQINKYVAANGTKPFKRAPDSQRAILNCKNLK